VLATGQNPRQTKAIWNEVHERLKHDEGAAFPSWKEPDEVLRWVRLAVGTRSGYPPPDLERYGDRVLSFHLESPPVSSSEIRARIARGEPIDELVPPAVAAAIRELGLYRGYTDHEPERT